MAAERVLRQVRSWTAAASPSKPFRMSVRPTASHTRVPAGRPIIAIARSPAAASQATPRREDTRRAAPERDLDRAAAPCSRARLVCFRHDLHRQHGDALLRRGPRLLRRHLAPPFKNLVGVHIMTPRHDRNRRARLQRLGHDPAFQCPGPLATLGPVELRLVSTTPLVDTSVTVSAMPRSSPQATINGRRPSPSAYVQPGFNEIAPSRPSPRPRWRDLTETSRLSRRGIAR